MRSLAFLSLLLLVSLTFADNTINVNFAGLLSGFAPSAESSWPSGAPAGNWPSGAPAGNWPPGNWPSGAPAGNWPSEKWSTGAPSTSPAWWSWGGWVYARTNDPNSDSNLVAFKRDNHGSLWETGRWSTYGKGVAGAVDPLGSQSSLIFSPDKAWVLTVNGGSNSISVFKRNWDGSLTFASMTSSYPSINSSTPATLTAWGNYVYVLNSGPALNSITGYTADWTTGMLTLLPGSQTSFGGNYGQILFSPDGKFLLTTGKGADHFRVFPLGTNWLPTTLAGVITPVNPGRKPFSLTFDRTGKFALVSLAFGGVGSYMLNLDGSLTLVQEYNASTAATCWIVRSANSDNFYAINAGTPSISGFTAAADGTFTRIKGGLLLAPTMTDDDVAVLSMGSVPLDSAVTSDNQYLYSLLGGRGTIAGFWIRADGTLLPRGETELQLPGYNGLNGLLAD